MNLLKKQKAEKPKHLCRNLTFTSCYFLYHFQLPIKIDIIKHRCEVAGKSTAVHAVILAPDDARIYVYPDFPEISDKEKVRE